MTGYVNDVVSTTHDPEITILILVARVCGRVIAGVGANVRLLVPGVVVPERGETTWWKWQLDDDVADLTGRNFFSIVSQHTHVITGDRLRARAGLDGEQAQAGTVGTHGPAC